DSSHSTLNEHQASMNIYGSAYGSSRTSMSTDSLSTDLGDGGVLQNSAHEPSSLFGDSQLRDSSGYGRHGDLNLRSLPSRAENNYYDSVPTSTFSISPLSGVSRASSIVSGGYDYSSYHSSASLAGLSNSLT